MLGEGSIWENDGRDWRKRVDKRSSGDVSCIPPTRATSCPRDLGGWDSQQRKNVFYTRCQILDKTCSLVIDNGSCTNLISSYVIKKFKIHYIKHPSLLNFNG
ncbi:hypothetical protein M9H77_21874 [Catharanthus roseus]|uniref:Uncharacterized protein n=1 Tax=Catharanthus roseus TaxID=4058 RepID=A0ACC0ASW8_CATRO|nr:hypothetical protein M9H77_21874 [Catharanthus roseus]